MLYLSLYLKTHRDRYYELLQDVRTKGAWEEWLVFFLEGAESTARQAADTAAELLRMFEEDRKLIQTLGRPASSALRLHAYFQKHPLLSITVAAQALQMSFPAITSSMKQLQRLGVVTELTGKQRGRMFAYQRYLAVVSAGTEPLR